MLVKVESRREEGNSPREDGSINDVNVLRAINLGVQVDDGSSTSEAAIGSDLGCANPVVGTTCAWSLWQTGNILLDSLVGSRNLELNDWVLFDGRHHALDASDNGCSIGIILEV